MIVYCDTSLLMSLYALDANSEAAAAAIEKSKSLIINQIQIFEFRNAMRARVFHGSITEAQLNAIFRSFESDFDSGFLVETKVDLDNLFRGCERMSQLYTATTGQRSFDLAHIEAASMLRATHFLTFDKRQGDLAKKLGFKVKL